jgi:hypothetical protein
MNEGHDTNLTFTRCPFEFVNTYGYFGLTWAGNRSNSFSTQKRCILIGLP